MAVLLGTHRHLSDLAAVNIRSRLLRADISHGKKMKTSTGAARLVAELETMPAGYVPAPATTPRTVEPDRTTPLLVNAKVSAVPVPTEMTQLATPEPLPSSTTPRDNAE